MAGKEAVDVLMAFIPTDGPGVEAEGSAAWDENDPMLEGFQDYYYFEVEDWGFGAGLRSEEGKAQGGGANAGKGFGTNKMHDPPGRANATQTAGGVSNKQSGGGGQFAGYLQTGDARNYPAEVHEITITKQVEMASVEFVRCCLNHIPFKRAILVKRKFTGNRDYNEAFLRIEFKEPLIIGIEWDEGEVMKEKLKFICRGVSVKYKPQLDTGKLGSERGTKWEPEQALANSSGQ